MNLSRLIPNCIMILFLAGTSALAPQGISAAFRVESESPDAITSPSTAETQDKAEEATPLSSPKSAPLTGADIANGIRENLMTDQSQLRLVAMGRAIFLYPEATKKSTKIKLQNEKIRGLNELIVLEEITSPEGAPFYRVRSTFSHDTGYVLVKDTHPSRLPETGARYARIEAAACDLLAEPQIKATVLFRESEHLVRILGEIDGYYYVLTQSGNYGYVLPAQVTPITPAEVTETLARMQSPAVQKIFQDPMRTASAANAAKMLLAGVDSLAVHLWTTAEAHAATQGALKKAAIAMLSVAVGSGAEPVGYEGIQFQPCPEVPMIREGEVLQRGLDFNLHGSIYTDSPLTSVSAEMVPLTGDGAAVSKKVTFLPEQSITAYSLTTKAYDSIDKAFDIKRLKAGQYRFTLTATTLAQAEPVTLVQANCNIVTMKKHTLTQNKFDDNYSDALEFFHGDTKAMLFPYYIGDGRGIGTDVFWRDAHIVRSSLGRVNIHAVPNFEAANYYLRNTYLRVSMLNHYTGVAAEGSTMLLRDLVDKSTPYVPRFQSNLEYLSHHTLGTAIDVNDNMYPNANIPRNHDLIGGEVRNHLTYLGIKTDETGIRYYDFAYDGSYSARYNKVPKTIINYLLYELAFFRAGFEWGFYYETTCDAMHFMLTENDINRHMHTDIGLRKVYEYIDPEWIYVPTPSPTPEPVRTPKGLITPDPNAKPTPAATPTPTK